MAYAYRPLTFLELQQAISVDPYVEDIGQYDIQAVTDPKPLSSPNLIEDVCMGLITVNTEQNKAIPAHASLTHYLQAFKKTLFPQRGGISYQLFHLYPSALSLR